jgi:hypothetical protein
MAETSCSKKRPKLFFEKLKKQRLLFLNRSKFTVLHNSKLYTCHSCFRADITRRYDKHWIVSLIWQHSGGDICTFFNFCDDDVVLPTYEAKITSYTLGLLTYVSKYYDSCYAKNKSNIIKFFLEHGIFLDRSVFPIVIYMHVYNIKFDAVDVNQLDNVFTW